MAFFDRLSKSVGKAADQAKFEADKLMRIRALDGELHQLDTQIQKATMAIGERAIELRAPGFEEMIQQVDDLKEEVAAKRAELEAVRAQKFDDIKPQVPPIAAAAPAPAATAPAAPEAIPEEGPSAAAEAHCPACGAAVQAGAVFCGNCGHRLAPPQS